MQRRPEVGEDGGAHPSAEGKGGEKDFSRELLFRWNKTLLKSLINICKIFFKAYLYNQKSLCIGMCATNKFDLGLLLYLIYKKMSCLTKYT